MILALYHSPDWLHTATGWAAPLILIVAGIGVVVAIILVIGITFKL